MEAITPETPNPGYLPALTTAPTRPVPIRSLTGASLAHNKVKGSFSHHWDQGKNVGYKLSPTGT